MLVVVLDLGGPGVVLCGGVAAEVVRVDFVGFVGEDAFFAEFDGVVGGYGCGENEEDAVRFGLGTVAVVGTLG